MKHNIFSLGLTILLLMSHGAKALAQNSDLITLKAEGNSTAESAVEAAREIQSEVIAENVRAQVLSLVGEKRFAKFKALVESRIVHQSAKFIPFVKPGVPVRQADGEWKMTVELKLSRSSLRKMIQAAGLLNDGEGPASVLPLVAFTDRDKNVSIRWWQGITKDDDHKLTAEISRLFYDKFQVELARQGFHLIKPLGLEFSPLPEVFQTERPSTQDLQFLSGFFMSPMAMTGEVSFKKAKDGSIALCSVKVQVVQVSSNSSSNSSSRVVAEVSKQFVSDTGPYENSLRSVVGSEFPELGKDLSTQVLEAWQRGTLNTNLMRLSLRGVMSPKQLSSFKSELLQNLTEIKSLKERMFSANGSLGEFVYELDYSGDAGIVADHLRHLHLGAFDTQVSQVADKNIEMKVKVR